MKKILFTAFVLVLFSVPTVVLADGASDFKTKCAACHGAGGNLLPKTARLLKADPKKLALKASQMNRDEMIAITEKGRDKMPAFEKELTQEQIADIADYIIAIKNKK
jgi:mono/diheme cytochrome c family protein